MPTYVAFLRAINVTGRFIRMRALAAAFHDLGHGDARTYLNSGNVIFTSRARSSDRLARAIEDGLEPRIGFRSEAFVRTAAQVRAVAQRALSLGTRVAEGGEVHVCFLPQAPGAEQAGALAAIANEVDDFEIAAREVYWLCRVSPSDSRFSNAVLERRLKLRSTLRRSSMLQGLAGLL